MLSPEKSCRFAVFFDTHYCLERDAKFSAGCAESDDTPRYMWMRKNLFPKLVEDIKAHAPSVCICTGDISEGSTDSDLARRELDEVFNVFEEAGLAVLNAKGTHEPESCYGEICYPRFSAILGEKIDKNYFSFQNKCGRFVIIDYLALEPGNEQAIWLKEQCASSPHDSPLFLFAHAPMVDFARPFFSCESMQSVLSDIFKDRLPTVFFCGHTHNQAFTAHLTLQGYFAQIKGSSVGFPDIPIENLKDRHVLLLKEKDTYYWGVPEDQCPGYWIMDIKGRIVTASWYGVGRGLLGQASLSVDGTAPKIIEKSDFKVDQIQIEDLPFIRDASLEVFMSGDIKGDFEFILNDCSLGHMAANSSFAGRRTLPLTKNAVKSLSESNELKIVKGDSTSWILSGARLVAHTYTGKYCVSRIPQTILAAGAYAEKTMDVGSFFRIVDKNEIALKLLIHRKNAEL
jgi:hypothetical protein